jgi:hypothetical protein
MTVQMTAGQARALGIDVAAPGRKRTTRKEVTGTPYRTACVLCGDTFTTIAAEDRHLKETRHPRYALILEVVS